MQCMHLDTCEHSFLPLVVLFLEKSDSGLDFFQFVDICLDFWGSVLDTRLETGFHNCQHKKEKTPFPLFLESILSNTSQPALAFVSTKPGWWWILFQYPFNRHSTRNFQVFLQSCCLACTEIFLLIFVLKVQGFALCSCKAPLSGHCLSCNVTGKQLFWWNAHSSLVKKQNTKLNFWLA